MTIERVQIGNTVVLRVAGRIDVVSAPQFEAACEASIGDGFTNLVIDLGDVTYISSMGLRSFVAITKKLKEKGGGLSVCRATALVWQVFEITRLAQIFPLHESVEAALMEG